MRRVYAGLVLALSGCDPTSGLADTAGAALPTQKRYFDGAGTRLVEGPWSRVVVDLDPDSLYHVGARRLDDDEPTFHLFGADVKSGCQVAPNAGTWLMGKPLPAPFRLLPFIESIDERGRGRMRFTTLDCQVQDLVIEDAGRPYARLYDNGYLVPTKQGYTFADPWSGESHEIAAKLQSVLVWQDAILLWADDTLKSFSGGFEPGQEWGNTPRSVVPLGAAFLVEDADGLHRVTLDHQSLAIESEDVLPGACGLQRSGLTPAGLEGYWVVLSQPCNNPKPTLVSLDPITFEALDSLELPFEADSRQARPLVSGLSETGESSPLKVAYLTNVDEEGLGTLWVWRPEGDEPIRIGERALLDPVALEGRDSDWAGIAQTNYQQLGDYSAHDRVRFDWDGTTEVIAERVVLNATTGELLVHFDGVAGELPLFSSTASYDVVAHGVPPNLGIASGLGGVRHYVRVDQFDGSSGRLRLGTDARDLREWDAIGEAVSLESPRFAWFMQAVLFLENWDPEQSTGSLVAYNYDLSSKTTIASGVSSFDLTSYPWDGVLYSVPKGKKRGIWFSKAK